MAAEIDTSKLTTFVYKDLGLERIKRELRILDRGRALVGWPGNGRKHREVTHFRQKNGNVGRRKSKAPGSVDVATIAIIHEFGSPKNNLPARPVMRQTNQRHARELQGFTRRLLLAIYGGRILPSKALAQLGVFWEGKIKQTFRDGVFAPLRPATIARKGSSKPLIDSGQLRQSVTSVVVGG